MRHLLNSTIALLMFGGAFNVALTPASAAVAENVTYQLGAIRFVIPRIEATGTPLSDNDFKALLDSASPDTLAQRLDKLNAGAITAPQMFFEISNGPTSGRVTYRDLKLSNVGNGMIESANVAGASADMKDVTGADVKATYGAMTAHKINLALILRLFTGRRSDPNEPLASAYEDFSADGFQMVTKDVDISMGKTTGSGIKMRPLATPFSELLTVLQQNATLGGKPSREQTLRIMPMIADIFQSIELGQVEARDMKVRVKKDAGGEFGIGRVYMGGFANGKLGEIAYENFVLAMPDGSAKLGRFSFRDLDLQRTFAALADAPRRGDTDFKNSNPRNLIPTLGQIQITGFDLDAPSTDGKGNSPDGKRIRFSLGKFEINASNYIEGIPSAISFAIQNFLFPVPKNPADPQLRGIADLGIEKIDLTQNLDIAWNETARELTIKDISLGLANLGSVRISGLIGNVPKDLFSSNMALAQAAAFGALIKSLDVGVDNQGLLEKGLQMQAKQSGQTTQQLQQMLVAGASLGIPSMLGNGPASRLLANALAKFAAEPRTLRISARAKDGLGAADLMLLSNPAALLDKLEVTASANE